MIHGALYTQQVNDKGRGVFTGEKLFEGTVIEVAPVIVMTAQDRILLDQTRLHDYIFEWQPDGVDMCCMALGWIPMYNHSPSANCEYFMDYTDDTMYLQTVRDIMPGEEITINYNGDWNNDKPVWFQLALDKS